MQIEVEGQTIKIERRDGKFIKPDVLKQLGGFNVALKPAYEPIIVAMAPRDGTFANNALTWGVAGLWIDGARVPTEDSLTIHNSGKRGIYGGSSYFESKTHTGDTHQGTGQALGRWPANFCHDGSDEVVGLFPVTGASNVRPPTGQDDRGVPGFVMRRVDSEARGHNDNGGSAARFFYCSKASRAERNAGLEDDEHNGHPCVKPLALMRYLVRLTRTPTGGTVADFFMGSGTTGIACVQENRDFIGVDLKAEYVEIARKRIENAQQEMESRLF